MIKLFTDKPILKSLLFFIFISFISCGPRSGVAETEGSDTITCGNPEMESKSSQWAADTLGISGDFNRGSKLFKQNCARCHVLTDQKINGPGLQGFYVRIPSPKTEWLRAFIVNNKKVHASGDPYAAKLRAANPATSMDIFEGILTEQEVNDIMIFIVGSNK